MQGEHDEPVDDGADQRRVGQSRLRRASLNMCMEEIQEQDDLSDHPGGATPHRPASYDDYLKASRGLREEKRRASSVNRIDIEKIREEYEGGEGNSEDEAEEETDQDEPPRRDSMRRDSMRLLRTMSVMGPRITDPSDSAAWEAMVHNLQHKMKKLDADGHFSGDDGETLRVPFYAPPVQRQRWDEDGMLPHLNWGDLFFDLFFIAAVYNVGEMLISAMSTYNESNDWLRATIYFVGIFGPIFVTWETDVYYSSRYMVIDYTHRLFEVIRFVFITMEVLSIRPIDELADPYTSISSFLLTLAVTMESLMHLLLNVELYYRAEGDRVAIMNHTLRKLKNQLIPTSLMYFAGCLSAAVLYFGSRDRNVERDMGAVWEVSDLPLTFTAIGYVTNTFFTLWRKLRSTSGMYGDVRDTYVPNNVDFLIQRYGEWFLLLLGEVVMAMVETTDAERDYLIAFFGSLTVIVLHTLKFESEPSHANGHALWRNVRNAACFSLLMQVLSIGLILLSVSYKILVTEDSFGIPGRRLTWSVCASLGWVLISLELMLLTHKGVKRGYRLLFRQGSNLEPKRMNWPLVIITFWKVALILFLLTIPTWNTDPNTAVIIGFFVVTAIALSRIVGWGFVNHQEVIQKAVSTVASSSKVAARRLANKVSFAMDNMGLSSHGSVNGRSVKSERDNGDKGSKRSRSVADDDEIQTALENESIPSSGSFASSKHRREDIYDEMFDAVILTDLKGFIVTVNQPALDVFGFMSKEDLVGENVSVLVGGGDAKHHDKYLERFHQKDKKYSQIGKQRVLFGKRKDGTEFPCIIGIKRSANGKYLVGFIRDMTGISSDDENGGQKITITNMELHNINYKIMDRLLDDKSFDCIVIINHHGIIQGVNTTLVKEFGYASKDDLVGENIGLLMGGSMDVNHHDAHLEKFRKRRQAASDEEKKKPMSKVLGHQRLLAAKRKDGSEFRCIIGVHGIEETEMLVGYIRNVEGVVPTMKKQQTQSNSSVSVGSIRSRLF